MKPPLEWVDGCIIRDSEGVYIVDDEGLTRSDADYIIAAVNACHRLGLTTSQLEAGVLEKLVQAAQTAYDYGSHPFDCPAHITSECDCGISGLSIALAPFTK